MQGLDIKITIVRILLVVVILAGLGGIYLVGKPLVMDVYDDLSRDTHLRGEVYTAEALDVTIQPIRLFYNRWGASSGYEGDLVHDGYHFKHGLGMYIPYRNLKSVGEVGTTQLGFRLGGEFNEIYFHACAETEWSDGYETGSYRLICYADGIEIYDTGFNDDTYAEEIQLDVAGVDEFVIELQETRGPDGTINLILGEFEASKLTVAEGN